MIATIASLALFQSPGGGGLGGVLMLPLFILVIFYFLLIFPQQKKQKRWQQMIGDLKNGDKITTQGGIRGTIIAVKDDALHLRCPPDNLRLEVSKASVVSVARDDEPKKSEK